MILQSHAGLAAVMSSHPEPCHTGLMLWWTWLAEQHAMPGYCIRWIEKELLDGRLLAWAACSTVRGWRANRAGVDRLTFSVIWDMAEDGTVVRQWAGRSVIRTCAKLAYDHAQAMIEGGFDADAPPPAVPLQAPHTWAQVMGQLFCREVPAQGRTCVELCCRKRWC